jgi:hypothetical protein
MRLPIVIASVLAVLAAGCATSGEARPRRPRTEISFRVVPIEDSKCLGGIAMQEIIVRNNTPGTRMILPACAVSGGVRIAVPPRVARRVEAEDTVRFQCGLQDIADPPDGTVDGTTVTLAVEVDGTTAMVAIDVVCSGTRIDPVFNPPGRSEGE